MEQKTFMFVLSWASIILILMLANKTKLGHVAIYYSLVLIILFLLATQYQTLAPIFSGVETIGQLNSSTGA